MNCFLRHTRRGQSVCCTAAFLNWLSLWEFESSLHFEFVVAWPFLLRVLFCCEVRSCGESLVSVVLSLLIVCLISLFSCFFAGPLSFGVCSGVARCCAVARVSDLVAGCRLGTP